MCTVNNCARWYVRKFKYEAVAYCAKE
jgi:hypothetical protein